MVIHKQNADICNNLYESIHIIDSSQKATL